MNHSTCLLKNCTWKPLFYTHSFYRFYNDDEIHYTNDEK